MFFFFNAPSTTEIYTLSLHDALPISRRKKSSISFGRIAALVALFLLIAIVLFWPITHHLHINLPQLASSDSDHQDRKSTRLNSSHLGISYAVFCLKKKKKKKNNTMKE